MPNHPFERLPDSAQSSAETSAIAQGRNGARQVQVGAVFAGAAAGTLLHNPVAACCLCSAASISCVTGTHDTEQASNRLLSEEESQSPADEQRDRGAGKVIESYFYGGAAAALALTNPVSAACCCFGAALQYTRGMRDIQKGTRAAGAPTEQPFFTAAFDQPSANSMQRGA